MRWRSISMARLSRRTRSFCRLYMRRMSFSLASKFGMDWRVRRSSCHKQPLCIKDEACETKFITTSMFVTVFGRWNAAMPGDSWVFRHAAENLGNVTCVEASHAFQQLRSRRTRSTHVTVASRRSLQSPVPPNGRCNGCQDDSLTTSEAWWSDDGVLLPVIFPVEPWLHSSWWAHLRTLEDYKGSWAPTRLIFWAMLSYRDLSNESSMRQSGDLCSGRGLAQSSPP